jgi:predicted phosphodiesterase
MRLALLADVHGNPIALEAVLRDVEINGGVDGYWLLGDLAALGYDPAGALERIASLPNATAVRGNTDRYLVTGERPGDTPTADRAQARPELVPQLVEVERSLTWAQGYVAARGWLEWLAALPAETRLTLPDGARMLGAHASPGQDDGPGLRDDAPNAEIALLIEACGADLVVAGHTHRAMDRVVDGVRVVNVGSVSNPSGMDRRASYALLEASAAGYEVSLRRVEYDRRAVVDAIQRIRYPAAADLWLLGKFADPPGSPATAVSAGVAS